MGCGSVTSVIAEFHVEAGRARFTAASKLGRGAEQRSFDGDRTVYTIATAFPGQRAKTPFAYRCILVDEGDFEGSFNSPGLSTSLFGFTVTS